MSKSLVIEQKRCTGCYSCVLTCSFVHEGYFSFSMSRIGVEKDEENASSDPRVCIQCENAPCIEVCPTDALCRNEIRGVIECKEERCVQCHLCAEACPYGGIRFEEGSDRLLICDLCGGDPACVKVCRFPQAIRYE